MYDQQRGAWVHSLAPFHWAVQPQTTILAGISNFSLQASGLLMGIAHWFKGKLWFSLVQWVAAFLFLPCIINWWKPFCCSAGRTWSLKWKEKTSLDLILFHAVLLPFYYEIKATCEQPSQVIQFCEFKERIIWKKKYIYMQ